MSKSAKSKTAYDNKYMEWTVLSLNQLSYTNNIFLTIAVALLSYIISRLGPVTDNYIFLAILLLISIIYGFLVLITRMYDFRITRHLVLVHFWASENNISDLLPTNNNSRNYSIWQRLIALITIVFVKLNFVLKEEVNSDRVSDLTCKVKDLYKLTNILGSATWRWVKLQIFFFLLSVIIYSWVLLYGK